MKICRAGDIKNYRIPVNAFTKSPIQAETAKPVEKIPENVSESARPVQRAKVRTVQTGFVEAYGDVLTAEYVLPEGQDKVRKAHVVQGTEKTLYSTKRIAVQDCPNVSRDINIKTLFHIEK